MMYQANSFWEVMIPIWIVAIIGGLLLGAIIDTVKNVKEGVSSWPLWGRVLLIIVAILLFPIVIVIAIVHSANKNTGER